MLEEELFAGLVFPRLVTVLILVLFSYVLTSAPVFELLSRLVSSNQYMLSSLSLIRGNIVSYIKDNLLLRIINAAKISCWLMTIRTVS